MSFKDNSNKKKNWYAFCDPAQYTALILKIILYNSIIHKNTKLLFGGCLNTYLEKSISAYKLVNKVTKLLEIDETPEISVQNGNVEKIILTCFKIIEQNYSDKRSKELLKYYVAHSFFEDYDLENHNDFSDELVN